MTQAVARKTKPGDEPKHSWRLAAIDVGSNSVHMIVAQIDADGGITTLWRMKEMVGLGRISFPGKRLSHEAMERAVASLARFKQAATQHGAERIIAVATSAIREAINGGDLIERVRRELKLYIKVVSARDEARLIYLGVRHAADLGKEPNLIIDIGGGSVEFIVGDAQSAALVESRKLGAARMTSGFVKSDPLAKVDRKALVAHFDKELGTLLPQIEKLGPKRVLGTSGTMENLAKLCGEVDHDGKPVITAKRFAHVFKNLVASDAAGREEMPALDAHRKEQVVAASVLVHYLIDKLGIKKIHMCDAALREGILVDYLTRHVPELDVRHEVADPRRRSVLDLARRCHWQQEHGEQVSKLTLRMFDELRELHGLGEKDRELIEYAAMLHDIGWHIGPDAHHKHSMYLIVHSDMHGHFSAEELGVIANITRYHRKREPTTKHAPYEKLSKHGRRTVDVGSAILRIADGMDRSHSSVVEDLKTRLDVDGGILCKLRVRADAELEMWGAKRKSGWFDKLFGRVIDFEIRDEIHHGGAETQRRTEEKEIGGMGLESGSRDFLRCDDVAGRELWSTRSITKRFR